MIEVTDKNIVLRLREDYLRRLARRLRWSFEDVVNDFGCERVEEGVYECYVVRIEGDKIYVNPYTLGLMEKLKDLMYRSVR